MSGGSRSDQPSGHLPSYAGGSTENQHAHSPKVSKPRSGPDVHSLARCAACYNSARRWGGGESSSSAEDSGPDIDSESEAESSSSSSSTCSGNVVADTPEKPETETQSPVCEEPKSGGDGGRQDEGKKMIRRHPLVKSSSLPASLSLCPAPLSQLPRRPRIVSTLRLQVCQNEEEDTFYTMRHRLAEGQESTRGEEVDGRGQINNPPPWQPFQWQHVGVPWQQGSQPTLQPSHLYQQPPQQPSYLQGLGPPQPFFSAQGQMLMPHPQPLPVLPPPTLHTPPTHVHGLTQHPYWHCNRTNYSNPQWNHYSRAQLHKY